MNRTANLIAVAIVAVAAICGCARLRGPANDGKMLLFSAIGELRPAPELFAGGRHPLDGIKPALAGRSLVMAGLAGGIGCDAATGPAWRDEWIDDLAAANIRALILADDHILNCGSQALAGGMNRLLLRDFYLCGAGPDQNMARAPVYLNREGIVLGMVAFLVGPLPGDSCADCPGPAIYQRQAMIAALKEMNSRSDFRVVILHFAERPSPALTVEEQAIAREVIDYGADLVLGYGPTVSGGILRVRGRWIIGSLGRGLGAAGDADGLMLSTEFVPDKMMNLRLLPVALDEGRPRLLRGDAASAVLKKIVAASPADAAGNMNLVGDILYLK